MGKLDADFLRQSLSESPMSKLDELEVFSSIASTNTYLMAQPSPAAGRFRVAVADHQTSGRGRRSRRWLSPPGAGLCMSLAFTFASPPRQLSALTLALGVGVVNTLAQLSVNGISLKWPNDIVALDAKLGGVLTEVQSGVGNTLTVVAGIGLNFDLSKELDLGEEAHWAHRAIDLKSVTKDHPPREVVAGALINAFYGTMLEYEEQGFGGFAEAWQRHDWLLGRAIVVDIADGQITGVAAGVDGNGALLVNSAAGQTRVVAGSILVADARGNGR